MCKDIQIQSCKETMWKKEISSLTLDMKKNLEENSYRSIQYERQNSVSMAAILGVKNWEV